MVMAIVGPVLRGGTRPVEPAGWASLAASLFATSPATQLPLGVALDAFPALRREQTIADGRCAAVGFAIFALSPGFARLVAARMVLGVRISAGLMAVIKAHADWFDRGRVAHVTGIATAIGALGSALTTSPVQAMLPTLGWRSSLLRLCLLALGGRDLDFPARLPDQAASPGQGANPAGRRPLSGAHSRLADLLASSLQQSRPCRCSTLPIQAFGQAPGCPRRGRNGRTSHEAGVLFLYTFAMVVRAACSAGSAASRVTAQAGLPPLHSRSDPRVACRHGAAAGGPDACNPSQPSVVLVLWLAIAVFDARRDRWAISCCARGFLHRCRPGQVSTTREHADAWRCLPGPGGDRLDPRSLAAHRVGRLGSGRLQLGPGVDRDAPGARGTRDGDCPATPAEVQGDTPSRRRAQIGNRSSAAGRECRIALCQYQLMSWNGYSQEGRPTRRAVWTARDQSAERSVDDDGRGPARTGKRATRGG